MKVRFQSSSVSLSFRLKSKVSIKQIFRIYSTTATESNSLVSTIGKGLKVFEAGNGTYKGNLLVSNDFLLIAHPNHRPLPILPPTAAPPQHWEKVVHNVRETNRNKNPNSAVVLRFMYHHHQRSQTTPRLRQRRRRGMNGTEWLEYIMNE